MAKKTKQSSSIPFTVFAILLLAIVGFHLQKQQRNNSVLGMSSGAPLFSKEWFGEILSFFGLGAKKETKTNQYSLPTYGSGQNGGGFVSTGDDESDAMLTELEDTSDDGGQSDFDSLKKEASGL